MSVVSDCFLYFVLWVTAILTEFEIFVSLLACLAIHVFYTSVSRKPHILQQSLGTKQHKNPGHIL